MSRVAAAGVRSAPLRAAHWGVFEVLVNVVAFSYILSAYSLRSIEYVSRVSLSLSLLLALMLALDMLMRGRIVVPKLAFVPWLFFAYAGIALFWAEKPMNGYEEVVRIFFNVLGGVSLWLATMRGLSWKTVIAAIVIGALILIATTRGETETAGAGERVAGVTGNANVLAVFLSYPLLFMWCTPVKVPKWLSLLGMSFIGFAFLYTGSRKTFFVIAAVVAMLVVRTVPRLRHFLGWITVGGTVAIAFVAFSLSNVYVSDVQQSVESTGAVQRLLNLFSGGPGDVRAALMRAAIEMWKEHPIMGSGPSQFAALSGWDSYSHCNYTELLANYGIIGFCLYYTFLVTLLSRALRGLRSGGVQYLTILLFLGFYLALDIAAVNYVERSVWMVLGLIAGLLTAQPATRSSPGVVQPRPYDFVPQRPARGMA